MFSLFPPLSLSLSQLSISQHRLLSILLKRKQRQNLYTFIYIDENILGYRNPFIINLSKFTCLIASCQLLPTICFLPLWKKQSYVSIPPSHAQVLIVVKVFAPGTRYVSAVIQMRLATKPLGVISSYSSTGRL